MPKNSSTPETTLAVVDGHPAHRDELGELLRRAGFRVLAYASAEDLLLELEAQRPGAIVTELELPGMNGLDLTLCLRARTDATPVVIVAREADVASAVSAMRNSVADFITRPFVERDLLRRVRAVLAAPVARGARGSSGLPPRYYAG